jgi:hypothetical protein
MVKAKRSVIVVYEDTEYRLKAGQEVKGDLPRDLRRVLQSNGYLETTGLSVVSKSPEGGNDIGAATPDQEGLHPRGPGSGPDAA